MPSLLWAISMQRLGERAVSYHGAKAFLGDCFLFDEPLCTPKIARHSCSENVPPPQADTWLPRHCCLLFFSRCGHLSDGGIQLLMSAPRNRLVTPKPNPGPGTQGMPSHCSFIFSGELYFFGGIPSTPHMTLIPGR